MLELPHLTCQRDPKSFTTLSGIPCEMPIVMILTWFERHFQQGPAKGSFRPSVQGCEADSSKCYCFATLWDRGFWGDGFPMNLLLLMVLVGSSFLLMNLFVNLSIPVFMNVKLGYPRCVDISVTRMLGALRWQLNLKKPSFKVLMRQELWLHSR